VRDRAKWATDGVLHRFPDTATRDAWIAEGAELPAGEGRRELISESDRIVRTTRSGGLRTPETPVIVHNAPVKALEPEREVPVALAQARALNAALKAIDAKYVGADGWAERCEAMDILLRGDK
jgi:hypothetical protein